MSDSTLYDDDILLWSEQQAAAIRRLRETARGFPNEVDIENVAEEIESVGRSELAAVESYIELILLHLIKLATEPEVQSASHWRQEIGAFHSGLRRRYAPSMSPRIDMDEIWGGALEQRRLAGAFGDAAAPEAEVNPCPIALRDLLARRLALGLLTEAVAVALTAGQR
jgi:hypothetical protein